MRKNIITEKIREALREGIKSRKKERVSTFRMLISELKNAELEERGQLTEEQEIAVISSYARKCRESILEFEKAGRDKLIPPAKREYEQVMEYLPAQLGEEKIRKEIKTIIDETGASGPRDMGRVIGAMMKKFKGQVDGNVVRDLTGKILKEE